MTACVVTASLWIYKFDSDNWNKGKCPSCGTAWKYKYLYKNSIRIYQCPKCGKEISIGWNVDKDKYRSLEEYEK